MSVLSIRNLTIRAWGATLIDRLSLDLAAGELLAIIGPNGAGKTSLINTIVNAGHKEQIVSGDIDICHRSYALWNQKERARQVALLPQLSTLNFPFTVTEVVELGRTPHCSGKDLDQSIIEEALIALDIAHLKNRFYTQLSGGEKQRVQLARVMVQIWREDDVIDGSMTKRSRLLILDEPTSSLDLGHQRQLMDVVRRFADQGVAIIVVAHDVNLIANHADSILALSCGQVMAQGKPENIITQKLISTLYQTDIDVILHPVTQKPMIV